MSIIQSKNTTRAKRHRRVRAKINGTATKPRLSVYRSNKFIYASLVDDENNKTLLSTTSAVLKKAKKTDGAKGLKVAFPGVELAYEVGKDLAKLALTKKISQVIFDRGGYQYTGQVASVAKGAREGGLKF